MEGVIPLLLAAIFWIATHNGFAGTDIRARLVGKIGEIGFRIAYAVTSIIAIMLLVQAWEGAGAMPLWVAPAWLRLVLALIMLPAFLFFAAGLLRNPTAVGGEALAGQQVRGSMTSPETSELIFTSVSGKIFPEPLTVSLIALDWTCSTYTSSPFGLALIRYQAKAISATNARTSK